MKIFALRSALDPTPAGGGCGWLRARSAAGRLMEADGLILLQMCCTKLCLSSSPSPGLFPSLLPSLLQVAALCAPLQAETGYLAYFLLFLALSAGSRSQAGAEDKAFTPHPAVGCSFAPAAASPWVESVGWLQPGQKPPQQPRTEQAASPAVAATRGALAELLVGVEKAEPGQFAARSVPRGGVGTSFGLLTWTQHPGERRSGGC